MKRKQSFDARLAQVSSALSEEMTRFNQSISNGAQVYLKTFNGPYRVLWIDRDMWYHTDGNGGFGQSWCGCNDGTWADLLRQAGIERHPLFA